MESLINESNGRQVPTPRQSGLLAISSQDRSDSENRIRATIGELGLSAKIELHNTLALAVWGLDQDEETVLLSRGVRRHEAILSSNDVGRMLSMGDLTGLSEVLAPFGAAHRVDESLDVVTDTLGFRHIYEFQGYGFAAISTSARALSFIAGRGTDREAIGVQSLLGWQVGQRTMFDAVKKSPPGSVMTLTRGRISVQRFGQDFPPPRPNSREAVLDAAKLLRNYMNAYLDDHPEGCLQLTGGQDSRILLGAIPKARRAGLRVMTLGDHASDDVAIAADLASSYGMDHQVVSMGGLEGLSDAQAYDLCVASSRSLDCMGDPLALAALLMAEAKIDQGPRLSGLGGEVARGFYYFGPAVRIPVSRRAVTVLTGWRMFANESVPGAALEPEFANWARVFTVDEIFRLMTATGLDWLAATDEFYLGQRMQRWAGVTDTAVCLDRAMTNPMLDNRFLDIARGLPPSSKRNSRFLSRLQVELDEELAQVPLDGRPPPAAYAHGSVMNSARESASTLRKIGRKSLQRLNRAQKPPAGGHTLAEKVTRHLRQHSEGIASVASLGVFRADWLDGVLRGDITPEPSAVAMLVNLIVATEPPAPGLA